MSIISTFRKWMGLDEPIIEVKELPKESLTKKRRKYKKPNKTQ